MNYPLLKAVLELVQAFEEQSSGSFSKPPGIADFKRWVAADFSGKTTLPEAHWPGKEKGRSPESIINTLLLHLNRYARTYAKAAIQNSAFSTPEEFIYLINLKTLGPMTKMALIKTNVQEKPVGMQILARVITAGWAVQSPSSKDKRSKEVRITPLGEAILENQMPYIRQASGIVAGNLTSNEQFQLIQLLTKLDAFHKQIYAQNLSSDTLLTRAVQIQKLALQP